MSVRSLKSVKITVPESLRVEAANDVNVKDSPKRTADTPGPAKAQARVKPKAAQQPSATKNISKKSAPDTSVESDGLGKELVRYNEPGEATEEEKHRYGIDIDETIRVSSEPDHLFEVKNRFSKLESRIALSAFAFIVFALSASWMAWDKDYAIVGNAETAYNYGLVGGLMMLAILLYALRKRFKKMRSAGDIKYWYYFHFIFGVIGPVLIILHTSFEIRSINAGFALFAMIGVVFSGFVGRYIYTRASYGLRSVERDLQIVSRQLKVGVLSSNYGSMEPVEKQIRQFTKMALSAPSNYVNMVNRALFIKNKARLFYASVTHVMASHMRSVAIKQRWTKAMYKECVIKEKKLIQAHLASVAGIASARAYEKLASKWRLLHVPILYLLE